MLEATFLCIGHRGASGYAPENTLKAFELAIQMGCPWIELDVYFVDGEIVVIHDDELERTTDGSGAVMDSTFAYLRSLDAGDKEQIPTLREVIELVDHRAGINIELKGKDTALAVNELLDDFINRGWKPTEFLFSSFNHRELELGRQDVPRGALFFKKPDDYFKRAAALNAYSINVSTDLVNESLVKTAHDQGLKVFVYTVNEAKDMQDLKNIGIDGVFTNYPDRCPND